MKTFTGVVTTAALLKTFAALFDELGGDVGVDRWQEGGHEAGAGVRMVMEKNDGPLGDAGSFTMESQARTR